MSRGRAWNMLCRECKDFSCFSLYPTWMRAGIVGSLSCSITTLIWGCAAGFAVRSTGRERILHPSPRTQGFASSVAGIPPSSFAGALGIWNFAPAKSSKLPGERCSSEVKQGQSPPVVCSVQGAGKFSTVDYYFTWKTLVMLEVLQAGGAGKSPVCCYYWWVFFSLQALKFAASSSVEMGL